MTLIVLMYHRASAGRHGNAPTMLDAHFAAIAERFHCVLPGDRLKDDRLNVCLSFDDGTYDFHAVVYPLLQKHGLRAVLAVPVSFLEESVRAPESIRLRACEERTADGGAVGAYCTWDELRELSASGLVSVAAHGLTHRRLDRDGVDLDAEISAPRTILSARLERPIDSFVLPYGRFDRRSLERIAREYRYVFRIGGGDNESWDGSLLYRIDADEMTAPDALFSRRRLAGYRLRRRWNRMRGR